MRPGVPWNVKGIEAEAREMAQLAARRSGVSLGEWLTQVIMTEGRGTPQQHYIPGDGTYGPQPQPQYQPPPLPSLRYPQAFPQHQPQNYQQPQPQPYSPVHPHTFQQNYPQAVPQHAPQQQPAQPYPRDPLSGAAQMLDSQIRGSEFTVVAHGLRDLADRLENSERRAQQSIASVNQSVAAMQDRIDAAERVKQLADVAFTSAADALAQSARDQSVAFDSMEATVRAVQKRLGEIEAGRSEAPNKDALSRLETALGQLQKRLNEMEAGKAELPNRDALFRLEATLGQLQKRLGEMEAGKADLPQKDALGRLENSLSEMRADVAESDKRSRDDLTQLAKYMRELSSRVDTTERNLSQSGGAGKLVDGVAARLDTLEARAASQFDELRGAISTMDGRLAQASANAKGGVQADSFAALKRSVDALSERLDDVGDPTGGPLAGPIGAMESTLETLTNKIEDGDRRAAESVSTVSSALKSISHRLEESEKRQTQSMQTLTRRLDESDRNAGDSTHGVEDALKALSQRLETSDKKHKEAIGGLRLTVDGLVARAAAEALPVDSMLAKATSIPSPLSGSSQFGAPPASSFSPPPPPSFNVPPPATVSAPPEPDFPPLATTTSQIISGSPPPLHSFVSDLPPKAQGDGYSVSALQTIMAGTLSAPPPSSDLTNFDPDDFAPETTAFDRDDLDAPPKKADDFLAQARRAAQAAAQAEAERAPQKRGGYVPYGKGETGGGRNVGRLMIVSLACIALVAGIIALLFTLPGGGEDGTNRPDAGASIGEILNGPSAPAAPTEPAPGSNPAPAAEFAPLPSAPEAAAAGVASVAVEPNGLGVPTTEPTVPAFTSGTSALPGGPTPDTAIASLETGAVRGDARSQFVLALRYAEGRGVEKDDAKAVSLVTKAAQQGLVVAEYRLGAIYERGIGVPKDLAQARNWYERAAKGGNRKAMHNLAVLYADGVGIGQNFQEAARWFRQGADFGLADSQYNLAILLERGMGVEKNVSEAAKWYSIASGQGDSGASERLDALKKQMSPADIALSLDAARNFKAKPLDPVSNEVPAVSG